MATYEYTYRKNGTVHLAARFDGPPLPPPGQDIDDEQAAELLELARRAHGGSGIVAIYAARRQERLWPKLR